MKEKKPGGTRPEMGTPEYEEWRKEVLKRRRKRQRRSSFSSVGAISRAPGLHMPQRCSIPASEAIPASNSSALPVKGTDIKVQFLL